MGLSKNSSQKAHANIAKHLGRHTLGKMSPKICLEGIGASSRISQSNVSSAHRQSYAQNLQVHEANHETAWEGGESFCGHPCSALESASNKAQNSHDPSFLPEKNWEYRGQEGIGKYLFFFPPNSGHFPLAKFSLNFWPVRDHEKQNLVAPQFCRFSCGFSTRL